MNSQPGNGRSPGPWIGDRPQSPGRLPPFSVVLALLIVGGCAFLALFRPQNLNTAGAWIVVLAPGTLGWLGRVAYEHWDFFYRLTAWIKAWVLNHSVTWDAEFSFYGVANRESLQDVKVSIRKRYPTSQVWAESSSKVVIKLPFGTIRLVDHPLGDRVSPLTGLERETQDSLHRLILEFGNVSTGYRNATWIIDHDVLPILETVRNIARPENSRYALRAHFPEGNPYFGLYVRRLGPPQLVQFDCEFLEKAADEQRVITVRKEHLEIVAHELTSFRSLVVNHLSIA